MFSKDVKRVAACLVAADPKLSLRQPLNRNNNIRWPVLQPGGLWTLTPTIETSALCIITNIECFEIDLICSPETRFSPLELQTMAQKRLRLFHRSVLGLCCAT